MFLTRIRRSALLAVLLAATGLGGAAPAAAFTPAEGKTPMTVTLVRSDARDCGSDCPEWLAMTGMIGPETPGRLKTALDRLGRRSVPILIDSPGGGVEAAMAMGRMIRERKLDVAVAGTALTECATADRVCMAHRRAGEYPGYVAGGIAACASACVLVLAAGTDRSVARDSYVGVHQMMTRRTFTRVINTFRIVRRLVGGHVVEVSRTLIATRPLSSNTVQSAAPEQLYSEVDHYLLGMGIGESIMPLMHGTPSTGIHWMIPVELAMTGIANDTTDARTLVSQAAEPASESVSTTPVEAAAVLVAGTDQRQDGTAGWTIERTSARGGGAAVLEAKIAIPGRRLDGTLSITRNTDPGKAASFVIGIALSMPDDAGASEIAIIWSPKLCEFGACAGAGIGGKLVKGGAGDYLFWVAPVREDEFLSGLRDRDGMTLPVIFRDGSSGEIRLGLVHALVDQWEHLCCGLAAPSQAIAPPPQARPAANKPASG